MLMARISGMEALALQDDRFASRDTVQAALLKEKSYETARLSL